MTYEWDIHISTGSAGSTVSFAIQNRIREIMTEHFPELLHFCSFKEASYTTEQTIQGEWLVLFMEDDGGQLPRIGNFSTKQLILDEIIQKAPFTEYKYSDLKVILGTPFFDFKRFTYIAKIVDGKISWPLLQEFLVDWLSDLVLPKVFSLNETSVKRALKVAPTYNPVDVTSGLCVLECEQDIRQGTGFFLKGYGIITCAHVLGKETKMFLPSNPSKKYSVILVKKNDVIDLAILKIEEEIDNAFFESSSSDSLNQMDHILISGFPNYRTGDSGVVIPGIITGFRTISAIRRLLTNASIVAGNSGGPVFDKNSKVIGVAVTGSDCTEKANETENHGIIPIEALKYLV